jgi:hypothetical protein
MSSKREEIMSAMQSVAGDIRPAPSRTAVTPQGVTVDIGGINLRNIGTSRTNGSKRALAPLTDGQQLQARRQDCHRRSILRLVGVFLTFMGIFPLYLVDVLPDAMDTFALWIGFVSLIGGMISFAAMSVYENA